MVNEMVRVGTFQVPWEDFLGAIGKLSPAQKSAVARALPTSFQSPVISRLEKELFTLSQRLDAANAMCRARLEAIARLEQERDAALNQLEAAELKAQSRGEALLKSERALNAAIAELEKQDADWAKERAEYAKHWEGRVAELEGKLANPKVPPVFQERVTELEEQLAAKTEQAASLQEELDEEEAAGCSLRDDIEQLRA